jgi:membrane-associated phospholipid phosphatase
MKVTVKVLVIIFLIPLAAMPQQKDSLTKKLDSLNIKWDSLQSRINNDNNANSYDPAKIDFKTYFTLLADNFKQQATAPFHIKKKDWLKVAGFALLTGGFALVNEPINDFAIKLHKENKGLADISHYVTNFGGAYEVYAIAGLYAYGLIFRTQKEKTTTALATHAYITAGVSSTIIKYLAGEQRPYYTDPNSLRQGPIFHGPFYPFTKGGDAHAYSSFPSGHTTAAFAAATVYALEYKNKPLIPIISYSAATLIGLSRITENKHWATDVLVGAMLGYLSGKQVVNNFHRYSRSKNGKGINQSISINLYYQNSQFLGGLVYKF